MPAWIHDRVEHLKAKNPSMPESEAWAISTQQSHALGKSPKGYGTVEGRETAKAKFDTPKDDVRTANPGHLKEAFTESQYSAGLNPVILSGASDLPPMRKPRLDKAIQKVGALSPSEHKALHEAVRTHADFDRRAGGGEDVSEPMRHNAERIQHLKAKKKDDAYKVPGWVGTAGGKPPANNAHEDLHMKWENARRQERAAQAAREAERGAHAAASDKAWAAAEARHASNTTKARVGRVVGKVLPHAAPIVGAVGGGLAAHAIRNHMKKSKEKEAASAPTRGNFMMASDIPSFRAPRLDKAIQKTGAEKYAMSSAEVASLVGVLMKESSVLVEHLVGAGAGGAAGGALGSKWKKHPTIGAALGGGLGALAGGVAPIFKESAVSTPAGQLSKTQSVGAPKASAPPGPSIADQTKPKGARFGVGIPGAFKTGIGGMSPQNLS